MKGCRAHKGRTGGGRTQGGCRMRGARGEGRQQEQVQPGGPTGRGCGTSGPGGPGRERSGDDGWRGHGERPRLRRRSPWAIGAGAAAPAGRSRTRCRRGSLLRPVRNPPPRQRAQEGGPVVKSGPPNDSEPHAPGRIDSRRSRPRPFKLAAVPPSRPGLGRRPLSGAGGRPPARAGRGPAEGPRACAEDSERGAPRSTDRPGRAGPGSGGPVEARFPKLASAPTGASLGCRC